MKRLLSFVLALTVMLSALGIGGSALAADEEGVTVTFGVYNSMYIMPPQKIYVTADLDDRYAAAIGWGDSVSDPSILDAIVKAHLVLFGEDFMDYAPIEITNQYGYPMFKNVFGESTNALGYRVNGGSPMSPDEALADGDAVEFYFYQDTYYYGDKYAAFDSREQTVKTGEELTLTMTVEDYDDDWNLSIVPAPDMTVVDADFNELGTTDENGQITLSFDKIGTYGITAVGMYENDYDEYDIFAPWCTVNVTNDLYRYVNAQLDAGEAYILDGYESFGIGDAVRLATVIMSGADMSRYAEGFADSVEENLAANSGKLLSPYSGKEDLGLYGAVIIALDAFGYVPDNFRGYDLTAAFDAADIEEARTHPYYARFAVEVADSEKGKAIIQDMIDTSYRMGAGLYNGVYCCDNTSYFLLTVSRYADAFSDYVADAKQVIQSYTRENGAYNDNVGMVTEVNADSTALAMAAYAAVGDMDGAFHYYKMLTENFEGDTGIFLLDGEEDYYATADAVLSLGYFRRAVEENNYEHPDHVWKTTVVPATYAAAGKETKVCKICGETAETVLPKLMKNGWFKENGKWFYYKDDAAQKYWQKVNGKWYYLNSKGEMVTGWLYAKGEWYYLDASGAMVTGWRYIGGKWYYLASDGAMKTGWLKDGGKWYYLESSGAMLANTAKKIGSKTYRFNASGVCTNP